MNPLTQADQEPFVIGGETVTEVEGKEINKSFEPLEGIRFFHDDHEDLNYAVVVDGDKLEASIHKVIEAAEATVDAFPASVALALLFNAKPEDLKGFTEVVTKDSSGKNLGVLVAALKNEYGTAWSNEVLNTWGKINPGDEILTQLTGSEFFEADLSSDSNIDKAEMYFVIDYEM